MKFHKIKRALLTVSLVLLYLSISFVTNAEVFDHITPSPSSESENYAKDEIIIKFKHEKAKKLNIQMSGLNRLQTGISSLDRLNEKYGVINMERMYKSYNKTPKRKLSDKAKMLRERLADTYIIKLKKGTDVLLAIEDYKKDENVEYAEPNYILTVDATYPNDTYFASDQWALNNTGQTIISDPGTADADIDAPEAWDITTGDPNIVIAIVDTGVEWDHPDLAANIWTNTGEVPGNGLDDDANGFIDDIRGWDFVSVPSSYVFHGEDPGPRDNDPMDIQGHGTHVSGTIGAVSNNSYGVASVAWDCSIMPVRAGYKRKGDGRGVLATVDIADAIIYASDNGAHVINMSFGGSSISNAIRSSVEYSHAAGVLLVASAGNSNSSTISYPAGYGEVISVSSTDNDDVKSSFSNYGSWIELASPGEKILSTYVGHNLAYMSGTSMSTPHVCGVAGLILSLSPGLSNEEVRQVLRKSVDDLGPSGWDQEYGYGRINAYNALLLVNQLNSVCTAMILSPVVNSNVSGTVDITGTASGSDFYSYDVYYGEGLTPAIWTQIGFTSYSQVSDGSLAAWNTTALPTGPYTILLQVTDTYSNIYFDRRYVHVDASSAGFTVSSISGDTTEAGVAATFTVRLNSSPSSDVTVSVSSSDISEGTVDKSSLTFTPVNWNVAQTVTVTGVDDYVADGDKEYSIVLDPAISADSAYNGLDPSDVTVTNLDDDSDPYCAPLASLKVTAGQSTYTAGETVEGDVIFTNNVGASITIDFIGNIYNGDGVNVYQRSGFTPIPTGITTGKLSDVFGTLYIDPTVPLGDYTLEISVSPREVSCTWVDSTIVTVSP